MIHLKTRFMPVFLVGKLKFKTLQKSCIFFEIHNMSYLLSTSATQFLRLIMSTCEIKPAVGLGKDGVGRLELRVP